MKKSGPALSEDGLVQQSFWSVPASDICHQLQTSPTGLSEEEAARRFKEYGPNLLKAEKRTGAITLLLSQFRSPIVLVLIFAAAVSFFVGDTLDATIIWVIILLSSLLSFWQERSADRSVQELLVMVETKASVVRDGKQEDISAKGVVPGDVVVLSAGDLVEGDSILLESKDLFINEASLTGETYSVEKSPGVLPPETALSQRTNTLFMGTNVVSGSAKAVVVRTGSGTEFGKVSERLTVKPPETEFERGVRQFGYFLMEVTAVLVVATFAINVYFSRPVLESLLFSLALAVGLTPELLPAIISVNLARGAKKMADEKVIVKRLESIENFGSMNVFCSDKTGTLTEGVIRVQSFVDYQGRENEKTLLYAFLNSHYETGYTNPIDEAIRTDETIRSHNFESLGYQKLDEVPYDFFRKRLSILVSKDGSNTMVTKGAVPDVLGICSRAESADGTVVELAQAQEQIQQCFEEFSGEGLRVLGIAYRDVGSDRTITKESEVGMTFLGFIVLHDPIKPDIVETIGKLKALGVTLKIITGDNRLVSGAVSREVGFTNPRVLAGPELLTMSDEALTEQVNQTDVFAEVEPNQKERIILAFKKAGNVVGYMGDGINDVSALHAADVGISVQSAVDVAKESAAIVLEESNLSVLIEGVKEGRRTFANTLKYIFMTVSSNFGNMFSMAGASLFLPFLPLLPTQVLLLNLVGDLPELAISTDNVDSELVDRPRRWNVSLIRDFMVVFGPLSSVYDYVTFGVLLLILHSSPALFRTGWFMESIVSETLIILVIRTTLPFYKSRPGTALAISALAVICVASIIPYTALGALFQFVPPPGWFNLVIAAIVAVYVASAEVTKRIFYKRVKL